MLTPEHSQWITSAAKYVVAAIVGAVITKRVEGRPRLITRWGHIAAFNTKAGDQQIVLHTHEVVLRNAGSKAAHNVRVSHRYLPEYNITPSVPVTVEALANGITDLVLPVVVPGQQITISYLYTPPLLYFDLHLGIRCDEGMATQVATEIQPKYSRWVTVPAAVLFLVGCATTVWALVRVASWIGL